jgi:hypothetical protein
MICFLLIGLRILEAAVDEAGLPDEAETGDELDSPARRFMGVYSSE